MSFLDRFKRKASDEKASENAPEVKSDAGTKPDSTPGACFFSYSPSAFGAVTLSFLARSPPVEEAFPLGRLV